MDSHFVANFHHRMDALPLLISQVTTCTTPSSRVGDAHIDHHHLDRGVVSYAAPLLDDEWADFHSFAVDFGILDGDDTDDKEKEEADEDEFATMPPVPVGMHWATEVMSAEHIDVAAHLEPPNPDDPDDDEREHVLNGDRRLRWTDMGGERLALALDGGAGDHGMRAAVSAAAETGEAAGATAETR